MTEVKSIALGLSGDQARILMQCALMWRSPGPSHDRDILVTRGCISWFDGGEGYPSRYVVTQVGREVAYSLWAQGGLHACQSGVP